MKKDKDTAKTTEKKLKLNTVTAAMAELIAGLFMIISNAIAFEQLIKVIGIIAAAYSLVNLIIGIIKKDKSNFIPVIMTSVLGIAAGAAFIFLTEEIKPVFAIIAGILLTVLGLSKIISAFKQKNAHPSMFIAIFSTGLVAVGTGAVPAILNVLSLTNGNDSVPEEVTAILLGVGLIACCAADICLTAISATGDSSLEEKKNLEEEKK